MIRLLLIETSATLRHAILKILPKSEYNITVCSTYECGFELLQQIKYNKDENPPHGLIIGWPGKTNPSADEVLSLIVEPVFKNLAVLIMAIESEPATLNWVVKRNKTGFLLWDDYQETKTSLAKIITASPEDSFKAGLMLPAFNEKFEKIKVLFVDDSPTVRVFFRKLLLQHGYGVETASSVKEGFDKARKNTYDIAIVDYFMPGGNGDQLCRQLHNDPKTSSIMSAIFTGTYTDQVIKDSLDAGAVECMFKNEADELFVARMQAMSRLINIRRSIEQEQKRLHGILGSVGDGVYGVNREGLITFVNPAAKTILGCPADFEMIGAMPHTLFHYAYADGTPTDVETCFLTQAYGLGDELHAWETTFWSEEKNPIPVECTVYPLYIEGEQAGSVVAFRDISERKLLEEELKWQVNHDHLTKLLNRHYFDDELKKEVWRLKRSTEIAALLYIDLDRFKYINDTAGHTAGDQLLIEVGQVLSARLRQSDLLARLGGDEFAVVLRNVDDADIFVLAEQFREVLHEYTFSYASKHYTIDASIGVARIDCNSKSPDEVLSDADIACHIAKQGGRNQCHVYVPENDAKQVMDMELGWSHRLRQALEEDLFVLHFQRILPIKSMDVDNLPKSSDEFMASYDINALDEPVHYEVLVRMQGGDGELVYPNAFIPTAERFNMMREIDRWIFVNAVKTLAKHNENNKPVHLGINLSGNSMDDEELLPFIKETFEEYDIPTNLIMFEITETSAISNVESAQRLINELRAIGCCFALDDFGCGFSSFSHLKQLPVDYIKIDGMFIQGMETDPMDQAMVRAITDIAHSVGKKTIAEYVESAQLVKLLSKYGVDYVQGFYVGKPNGKFI
ncbi:MAG: EAL domain-containing protein [Methylococcales bacterium]|nr:EAL domain-containing protein [Methylococcales bacterium]